MPSRKKKSEIASKWIEATTCHGVKEVAEAKSKAAKYIWISILALHFIILSYQLYKIIDQFGQGNWATSIQEERNSGLCGCN